MKKVIAVIAVIVIAVIAWLAFGSSNKNANSPGNPANSSSSNSSSNQNTQPQATNSVTIQNFAFNPSDITVKKGTTVTWTNQDSTGHTVTESDGQTGPASQVLGSGQTYSFTFNQAGTFHYHCTIHSEMTGSVTVTE